MNPFTFGNPIKDPARFFGRGDDLRQIVNRLLSSAHESTSIIGERRIGKTSLLCNLADPDAATGLGLASEKFCMVYVDFQGLTDITPHRFWQRIFKKMSHSICDQSLIPMIQEIGQLDEFDLFDLEDVFQEVADRGMTTVLLLDEFEYVTQNPNFKGDFFGALRALAIHHGVALVPATRRELVDLCHSDEIKGSPFFNIFANVVLRPFSQVETNEMLDFYLKGEDLLFPDERDLIWKLSGGYPFFVQMAGHYLVEGKLQGQGALNDYMSNQFTQQADPHFAYLWSHCSDSERITLLVILTLGMQKTSKKTVPTLENLIAVRPRAAQDVFSLGKRGIVIEHNKAFSIFSSSFVQWIQQEILASPGEEETQASAEDWVKAGGQATISEATNVLPRFRKKYWPILGEFMQELTIKLVVDGAAGLLFTLL
jgi:AAA+ ATPase superfamily predicted ATPase